LANDLGNLANRSLSMLERYFEGVVPESSGASELSQAAESAARQLDQQLRGFNTQRALIALWELIGAVNKYIDTQAPWKLAKSPASRDQLGSVLYECMEALRVIAVLLEPFLPETSARILGCLGDPAPGATLHEKLRWGGLVPGTQTRKGEPLFPRIETS
ncbi:MAG: class I tRNA ligase family protein, partial [Myxococcales bacterium]|nr:class I tRNA ligase family protein [Myxococcales bacterium]